MAKPTKLTPHSFGKSSGKRGKHKRPFKYFYLIICEGEKTEPLYFKELKAKLPKDVLETYSFDIRGLATNTTDLVKKAKKITAEIKNKTAHRIDKIWVVFDRDSFDVENFNNAVQICNQTKNMEAAFTNEAFELWFMLHFQHIDAGLSREDYKTKLTEYITQKAGTKIIYAKNNPLNHHLVTTHGKQEHAIKNAIKLEKLYEGRTDYANHNPRTAVHRLIIELFNLEEQLKQEKDGTEIT